MNFNFTINEKTVDTFDGMLGITEERADFLRAWLHDNFGSTRLECMALDKEMSAVDKGLEEGEHYCPRTLYDLVITKKMINSGFEINEILYVARQGYQASANAARSRKGTGIGELIEKLMTHSMA